jgi:hypothetical protein
VGGLGRARLGGLNLGDSTDGVGHGAVGKGIYGCVGLAAGPHRTQSGIVGYTVVFLAQFWASYLR